jgi:hypothetical protein
MRNCALQLLLYSAVWNQCSQNAHQRPASEKLSAQKSAKVSAVDFASDVFAQMPPKAPVAAAPIKVDAACEEGTAGSSIALPPDLFNRMSVFSLVL